MASSFAPPVVSAERSAAVSSQSARRAPPSGAGFTRLKYPSTVALHGEPGNGLSSLAAPASEVVRYMMRSQTVTSRPALTCQVAMGVPVRPRFSRRPSTRPVTSLQGRAGKPLRRSENPSTSASPADRSTSPPGMSAPSCKARGPPCAARPTNTDRTRELFTSRRAESSGPAAFWAAARNATIASATIAGLAGAGGDLRPRRAGGEHPAGPESAGRRCRREPRCPWGRRAPAPAPGPTRWRAPARQARAAGRVARSGKCATAGGVRGPHGPRPAS